MASAGSSPAALTNSHRPPMATDRETKANEIDDPILRLCSYWLSSKIMHEHVHELVDDFFDLAYEDDFSLWYEFRTYYSYWLSSLYVVVEGFEYLKLDRKKVPSISDNRIETLRLFRNATFHYQNNYDKQVKFHKKDLDMMNFSEQLHHEFERYFKSYLETLGISFEDFEHPTS